MPIIGLTDRGAQFPRIGELRKGAPKPTQGNKPGADLKHFRFTSTNADVVKSFVNAFGNEPNELRIFLPYPTTEENFEAWIEEWGAGSLKWRGDGQTLHIWQTPQGTFSHEPKPQPSGQGKQVGRLKVIIPELGRLAYVVALTTSTHDIMELTSNLRAYEATRGSLQGIPFILSRVPRMVSTPGKNGRVRREKWLLHIEAAPEWVAAQLATMQQSALPEYHAPLAIGDGAPDDFDVDDDGVIIDDGKGNEEWHESVDSELVEVPTSDETITNIDTIRNDLARYTKMTFVQVAQAASETGLYNSKEHAENALKQNESFNKSGGKLSAGIDGAVGLEVFDWLMARKQGANAGLSDSDKEAIEQQIASGAYE
jgi:hypothetical protein